jgi:uncharacterized repeat protein (TIGR04076 family)
MRLIVEVIEISGNCSVYKPGDRIVLDDGYKVNMKETDSICMHSLASLLPSYNALAKGVSAVKLGLAKEGEEAYVQCMDPKEYTEGGTVIFKISRVE